MQIPAVCVHCVVIMDQSPVQKLMEIGLVGLERTVA